MGVESLAQWHKKLPTKLLHSGQQPTENVVTEQPTAKRNSKAC